MELKLKIKLYAAIEKLSTQRLKKIQNILGVINWGVATKLTAFIIV